MLRALLEPCATFTCCPPALESKISLHLTSILMPNSTIPGWVINPITDPQQFNPVFLAVLICDISPVSEWELVAIKDTFVSD